ncbi:hypothetical protein GGR55DRAFT_696476 [Xylaria sp. FL0064]|nr:hypothetical protein GGR55DRAFT_696476 [Xylaria sp. FL0064]
MSVSVTLADVLISRFNPATAPGARVQTTNTFSFPSLSHQRAPMVVSLRSPRRALVATFLLTSFFLLLALHHRDSIIRPTNYDPSLFPPSENGKATTTSSVAVRPQEKEGKKGDGDVDQKEEGKEGKKKQGGGKEEHDLELVVASVKAEDTSWFHAYLPSWHKNIYVADDPSAPLTVPTNKGREAMVYLTYMIDRYDTLPANVLFVHASRFAWHNDDPDYDALPTLRNFRLPYLRAKGYVNLRCVWVIGCPAEIRPAQDEAIAPTTTVDGEKAEKIQAKHIYKQAFEELLPSTPVPEVVAVSCCSQFGVTRETIRSRPREDYIRYREWLLATPLDDALNGRVFEFAWHIIFGKEAVHCPSAAACYCNVFGLCDMAVSACQEDSCDGRYVLPPYSTLPKGWPLVGWEQEARNFTGPL